MKIIHQGLDYFKIVGSGNIRTEIRYPDETKRVCKCAVVSEIFSLIPIVYEERSYSQATFFNAEDRSIFAKVTELGSVEIEVKGLFFVKYKNRSSEILEKVFQILNSEENFIWRVSWIDYSILHTGKITNLLKRSSFENLKYQEFGYQNNLGKRQVETLGAWNRSIAVKNYDKSALIEKLSKKKKSEYALEFKSKYPEVTDKLYNFEVRLLYENELQKISCFKNGKLDLKEIKEVVFQALKVRTKLNQQIYKFLEGE